MKNPFDQRTVGHFDWPLFGCTAAILALGLLNLYSATYSPGQGADRHFQLQAIWMGMGVIVVGVLLLFSYRQIDRLSYPIYLFTLLLLALVAVKGHSVLGAQRWLQLGPLVLQPSEVIKPAIVIALSKYFYARKSQQLMDLRGVFLPCLITLVPAILILKQPDLGTAIIVVI